MLILLDISLAFHDIIIRPAAAYLSMMVRCKGEQKIATELLIWR